MTRAWGWASTAAALALGVAGCSMFRHDIEIVVRDPAGKPVDVCQVHKAGYQRRLPFRVPRDAGRIQVTLRRLEPGERELTPEELLQEMQSAEPAEP